MNGQWLLDIELTVTGGRCNGRTTAAAAILNKQQIKNEKDDKYRDRGEQEKRERRLGGTVRRRLDEAGGEEGERERRHKDGGDGRERETTQGRGIRMNV